MGMLGKLFGRKNHSKELENSNLSSKYFDLFIKKYPPSGELVKPTKEMVEWYKDKLPEKLIGFWQEHGFGNYGNGLIKVVEPSEYMDSLYLWLGKEDRTKLPVFVTAFGDIFYYRKRSDSDEDICLLDIHYRQIYVCDYSLESFMENYITDDDLSEEVCKCILFNQALEKKGKLDYEEIYYFVPALVIGGNEDVKNIDKGVANIHHSILFQMNN